MGMLARERLERFVEEHADRAYRFAYGLCGNEPEARELVQEAFVKVLDRADRYDETMPLDSWFLTVLKNVFRDGLRRWERRSRVSLDMTIGEDGLTVADVVADAREEAALERLERLEDGERLRRAVDGLPPDQRAALLLVDLEGLEHERAAQALDCRPATLRSRLFRARAAVRAALVEEEAAA